MALQFTMCKEDRWAVLTLQCFLSWMCFAVLLQVSLTRKTFVTIVTRISEEECIFWWRNILFFWVNSFPHVSQQNYSGEASETKWTSLLWSSRLFSELNFSEQLLQVKSPFLWTFLCLDKFVTKVKDFPHCSQIKGNHN